MTAATLATGSATYERLLQIPDTPAAASTTPIQQNDEFNFFSNFGNTQHLESVDNGAENSTNSSSYDFLTGGGLLGALALVARVWKQKQRRGGGILDAKTSKKYRKSVSVLHSALGLTKKIPTFPPSARVGVLLVNIGSPKTTDVPDVREYLSKFLGDDRVIDVKPKWLKNIILQILLFVRPKSSAEAYKNVFTERGSPLIFHTDDLALKVQKRLGPRFEVRAAMRYSQPYLDKVLEQFSNKGINKILVMPMFPQSASATTGSVLQFVYEQVAKQFVVPHIYAVPPFFRDNRFIRLWTDKISKEIGTKENRKVDHLVISFHGILLFFNFFKTDQYI